MSVVEELQSTPFDSRSVKDNRSAYRLHSDDDAAVRSPSAKRQKTLYEKRDKTSALDHAHYTIAWICALHIEMAAAIAVLDKKHRELPKPANDKNSYVLGSIQDHNIVIAGLPSNEYGLINATHVLTDLLRTFPSIRQGLMVGVGGGVPSEVDVRLGDVVVGTRVMNIDLGKALTGGKIHRTAVPKKPSSSLCRAITKLRASHESEPINLAAVAREKMKNLPGYHHPRTPDQLFPADYVHVSPGPECDECDQSMLKVRETRTSQEPRIHYGGIASSNLLRRDAQSRDKIAKELDIICFEMEAAGLMDVLACLPIRGICDYSDSHKSKEWQRYAAANAAAYARCLLGNLTAIEVNPGALNSTHRPVAVDTDVNTDHRRQLLKCLKFQAMNSRKLDIRENDEQTCQWFLDSPVYHDWLDHGKRASHHGLLWIRGKPGAGKSTLMKFLYSMSKKRDQSGESLTISFFFHARGDTLEKTVFGMYRSLLLQILQGFPHVQHILDNTELVPRGEESCPPVNALKELIRDAVVSLEEEALTCFVDALDECDEQQMTDMVEFLGDLAKRCVARNISLLVCFSSRHYPYIDIRHGIPVVLEDEPGHTADLNKVIDNSLRILDPALKNELKSVMLEKAAGVFLWVFLVVRILNEEDGGGGLRLRKKLEEVPTDLSKLFRNLLTRDQEKMEDLRLSIMWILNARRPLRPEEFYHAMWAGLLLESKGDPEMPNVNAPGAAIRFNGCVTSYTKGLAEITKDERNPTVQFIHESVRDFLVRDDGLRSIWPEVGADLEARSHDRLKSCCLTYFRHREVRNILGGRTRDLLAWKDLSQYTSRIGEAFPFLKYAVDSVLYHANAASDLVPQGLFMDKFPVQYWISCSDICHGSLGWQYSTDADLLYILVKQRYPALVRVRLEGHPNIAVSQRSGDFPVTAAAANEDKETMSMLMDSGRDTLWANGHWQRPNNEAADPIHVACKKGDLDMVQWLHMKGLVVHERHLRSAVGKGRSKMARWLIATGAVADYKSNYSKDTLILALQNNCLAAARLLLKHGVRINSNVCLLGNGNLLCHVSKSRHQIPLAKLLIKRGFAVDSRDDEGRTFLSHAFQRPFNEPWVRYLLDRKASVESRDRNGRTPLSWAAEGGNEAGIRFLLALGVNTESRDDFGHTPLSWAARGGNEVGVRLLLDSGVDIESTNGRGQRPLFWAAQQNNASALHLLLERGADTNARDDAQRTALSGAALFGPELSVRSLLDAGSDIESKDRGGCTPLALAVKTGNEYAVRVLFEKGADIESTNVEGITPCSQGDDRLAMLLHSMVINNRS